MSNLCRSDTRSSPYVVTRMFIPLHAWLYIKRMVIHIYMYSGISLYHMLLYTWLYIMVCGYTHNFAYVTTSYTRIPSFCTLFLYSNIALCVSSPPSQSTPPSPLLAVPTHQQTLYQSPYCRPTNENTCI